MDIANHLRSMLSKFGVADPTILAGLKEVQRNALVGDAWLSMVIRRKLLYEHPSADVGEITIRAKVFLSNESMRDYLLQTGLIVNTMSAHNCGTIFECLLTEKTKSAVLDDYISWVESQQSDDYRFVSDFTTTY